MNGNIKQSLFPKIALFAVLIVTILVYLPILSNEFVWDDHQFFEEWKTIKTLNNIPKLLSGNTPIEHRGIYRPIRSLLYTFSYQINRDNPIGYRIQAILLHLLGTTLVYFITKKLITSYFEPRTSYLVPFLTALFFGLHPIHTENIAFATASFDLFGLIFSLIAVYLFIHFSYNKSRVTHLYISSIACATLAFFTTELTLSLPLLILLLLCFKKGYVSAKKMFMQVFPYFLSAGIYIAIRFLFVPQVARATYIGNSLWLTLQVTSEAILRYIYILFFPIGLSVAPQFAHGITPETMEQVSKGNIHFISYYPILGSLILFCILFIGYRSWKHHRLISLGIIWFLICLLPVSNIVPTGTIYAERYLYVASYGFILILVYTLQLLLQQKILTIPTFSLAILVCVSWGFLTVIRNTQWQSDLTLWRSAAEIAPQSPSVLTNLGFAYKKINQNTEALAWYNKALTIDPTFARAINNIGIILVDQNDYQKALKMFLKAHEYTPSNPTFCANAAEMYLKLERPTNARDMLITATTIAPDNPTFWYSLGNVYIRTNQLTQAVTSLTKAHELDPTDNNINNNLATVFMSMNAYERAIKVLNDALLVDYSDPNIFFNLASAQEALGNKEKALDAYLQVKTLAPDFPHVQEKINRLSVP